MTRHGLTERLRKELAFTDEDLALNRQGKLSDAQRSTLEGQRSRQSKQLLYFSLAVGVAGIVGLFYEPMLGIIALMAAAGAFGLRALGAYGHQRQAISREGACTIISGPVALHRTSRAGDTGPAFEYHVWLNVQATERPDGRTVTAAEQVKTVPKSVWDAFVDGATYRAYLCHEFLVAAECLAPPQTD
ncbi:hypothetical protein [Salisaeta longa]|uniref:hypothetical protein n=1 Tax=Salisaeta longa TaxID=503170 RepID=UPI0003B3D15B|nr:hypothetical protein [Salisaeta longa]